MLQSLTSHSNHPPTFGEGKIVYSQMKAYYRPAQTSSLSIKLVLEGQEHYVLNGVAYQVQAGQFLLVNDQSEVEINFDEKSTVRGLCFYPPLALVQAIDQQYTTSLKRLLETGSEQPKVPHFTEKVYHLKENKLGVFLKQQGQALIQNKGPLNSAQSDYFHQQLIENLLLSQQNIQTKLEQLHSSKQQTKEELFRRLSLVWNYIEDCYTEKISLEQLAQLACLSKYHLIRSYKSLYACSPYQHILQKRLALAQQLLATGHYSMQAITLETGFSDVKNLRKALKKMGQ